MINVACINLSLLCWFFKSSMNDTKDSFLTTRAHFSFSFIFFSPFFFLWLLFNEKRKKQRHLK